MGTLTSSESFSAGRISTVTHPPTLLVPARTHENRIDTDPLFAPFLSSPNAKSEPSDAQHSGEGLVVSIAQKYEQRTTTAVFACARGVARVLTVCRWR